MADATVIGPQLSLNPAFTGGLTTGWTGFNGTLTGSTSPPAGCPEATAATYVNAGVTAGAAEGTVWWTAQASAAYTMSAWVYTTNPSVQIGFDWENAAGTYVGNTLATVSVTASTWTLVTTTQVSNVAAGRGRARVGATALSVTIWVTDVDAWLAGAGPPWRWRGSPVAVNAPSPPVLVAAVSVPAPTVTGTDVTITPAVWPLV